MFEGAEEDIWTEEGTEENCKQRNFIICTPYIILFR
jgi:hypothetical protein